MDLEEKILNKISIEDLPEEMRYIAEFIGLENVKTIMKVGGGSRISIPMPTSFKTLVLERHIKTLKEPPDFSGVRKLCKEYVINDTIVRELLKKRFE